MVFNPGVEIQEKFLLVWVWNVWEVPQSSLGWTGQFQLQPPQPVGPHGHRGLPDTLLILFCASSSSNTAQSREKGLLQGLPQSQGSFWGTPQPGWAGLRALSGKEPRRGDPVTFQFLLSISAARLGSGRGLGHTTTFSSPRGMD